MLKYAKELFDITHEEGMARNIIAMLFERNETDINAYAPYINVLSNSVTVVDHIVPHRGDQKLFWDRSNWQPLCEHHHNVKTMTEDRFKEYRF